MNTIAALEPLTQVSDEEPLFEIIDGKRVEVPRMSYFAGLIATRLVTEIQNVAKRHNLGHAATEVLFRLALPVDRNRRPDLAYVSYERWPQDRPKNKDANAWDVVPDLAVEVVSPNDDAEELLVKLDEYFRAGVRLVWVVYPKLALIYVYESPTAVRVLTRGDTLDGGTVLPDFRLSLQELFIEE